MFDYKCVGLDIFVIHSGLPKIPEKLGDFKLESISQRGFKLWPGTAAAEAKGNWFCCRFRGEGITDEAIKKLLLEIEKHAIWEKIQKLWQDSSGQDLFLGAYES